MSKNLYIDFITRAEVSGKEETLQFSKGVNAIVGEPNTGKTTWLRMLDYLLGYTRAIEDTISGSDKEGVSILDRYQSISGRIVAGGTGYNLERRLSDAGTKGKIFVDGEPISSSDFSSFILNALEIPEIHFPKGNPYAERSWPVLSWKMLSRHIYRQDRFWGDIADKQHEFEQFAVLMQFLGIAEFLFSNEVGRAVSLRKELYRLEARKEEFESILDNIINQMTSSDDPTSFATKDSIEQIIKGEQRRRGEFVQQKDSVLKALVDGNKKIISGQEKELGKKRNELILAIDKLIVEERSIEVRLQKLSTLKQKVEAEISRLERSSEAGSILAGIRVSHCPACDQAISPASPEDQCYVCHQPTTKASNGNRIEFEKAQLRAETKELEPLINALELDLGIIATKKKSLQDQFKGVESRLNEIRSDLAAFVPPEVTLINIEIGRIDEKIENYARLKANVARKDALVKEINDLKKNIKKVSKQVDEQTVEIDFELKSELLREGILGYLNALGDKWNAGRIQLDLSERKFRFRSGRQDWSKALGATNRLYFLLSYHYGLLTLTGKEGCHYPGLAIIDFPPSLADVEIRNKENYLVEPFVDLCSEENSKYQIIVTGRDYENLEVSNRIELDHIWI